MHIFFALFGFLNMASSQDAGSVEEQIAALSERVQSLEWGQYIVVQTEMTWEDANNFCAAQYGTTLATITNDIDAQTFIDISTHFEKKEKLWIGLNDIVGPENSWASGYKCRSDDGYCGMQGVPNYRLEAFAAHNSGCKYIQTAFTDKSNLVKRYSCDAGKTFFFACDAPTESRLFSVAERVRSLESGQYIAVETKMNWKDANDFCVSQYGTTLATLTNDFDAQAMVEMSARFGHIEKIWIGLNDFGDSNDYRWVSGYKCDGDCADDDIFKYWRDKPSSPGKGHCAYIQSGRQYPEGAIDDKENLVHSYPCGYQYYFACDAPVESALFSVQSDVESFGQRIAALEAIAANEGAAPFVLPGDYVLYALVTVNMVLALCLVVFCSNGRTPTQYKVVQYDTDSKL